ncbi:putative uncharacterized protein DDB_G0271606 isoform X2 [Sitodiplosis mosellana]|uniref:putative uncharacterized protein DDB_G0271606 isoform X2 n=1 Tax=Sitodiplosis mosellana TaxID=263140 RepID=UPI002444CE93|nr:putative uncharacterized protein DDB_G0271606 isoform X2 [Sitodiplosis mosellana]
MYLQASIMGFESNTNLISSQSITLNLESYALEMNNSFNCSENARKDLEIKFQRLMKERNDCEKSASIHKSKYDTLLQHERKRLNRNEELLQMLEEVQTKAAAMASNTEKLKRLKTQQERIVINNWRRSAYYHQQLMYPNVLFSNAAHCLPAPASYEYHNRVINCTGAGASAGAVGDNSRPLIFERPAHLDEVQEPVYQKSNDDKSMGNTSTTVQQHVTTQPMPTTAIVREIPCPSLPLMPIYNNDTDAPLFNELFHLQRSQLPLRTLETQPFIQKIMTPTQTIFDNKPTIHFKELPSNNQTRNEHIGYYSNRWGSDFTNSHLLTNTLSDGLNHNKYFDSIPSSGNYVPVMMAQHKTSLDIPLTKLADDSQRSQPNISARSQPYSSIGYVNQPPPQQQQQLQQQQQDMQYFSLKPQFSFIEESTSQKAVEPTGVSNLTSHQKHQVIQPMPTFTSYSQQLRNKAVEPPLYDAKNIHMDEIKPRQSIENNYEGSNNTTPWNKDVGKDEYLHERELDDYNILPRVESADSRQSVKSPSLTDVDDISSLARSPPKDMHNFSFNDDIQHITQSVKSSIPNDEMPEEARYQYEGIADNAYYNKSPTTSMQQVTGTQETRKHFFLPSDSQEKPTKFGDKRRSSFDSGSLTKSADDDSELRKKSIAANVRRRYSVAANLLDLQKNVTNIEPFQLQSLSAINYRGNGNTFGNSRNSFDNQSSNAPRSDIFSTFTGGQENKRNSIDPEAAVKIEDIVESAGVVDYTDQQISSVSVVNSQQPVEAMHDNEYGRDLNQSDISSYYVTDNNAPYSTYETNDQAYVETAMENLHLDSSAMEQQKQLTNEVQLKQFGDEADKIRVSSTHSKTVTWADDPHNNYKKEEEEEADKAQFYEIQNTAHEAPTEAYYAGHPEESQQFQSEYSPQVNTQHNVEPNGVHYQYDDNNQYQAQTDIAANQNVYNNEEYYYPDDHLIQYEQYESQQQQQQQQQPQQDPQRIQYYANDMIGNDGSSMSRLPSSDGYQQYETQSALQAQLKHDDYYTVSPGENYYSDYGTVDQNQTYSTNATFDNSHELPTSSLVAVDQHGRQQQQPQQQPQQQQQQPQQRQSQQSQQKIEYTTNAEPASDIRIPNYLQSDTDDSQTGYANNPSNKIQQDSDFDFSTNSETN